MALGEDVHKRRRLITIGICSFLLVAMVIAVIVGFTVNGDESLKDSNRKSTHTVSPSMKAITSICQPVDYRKTCEQTLQKSAGNTTDPKELIKIVFKIGEKYISIAASKSVLLHDLYNDHRTKDALVGCKELMHMSVDELKNSVEKIDDLYVGNLDKVVEDLRTWLSAAITYQETCLNGFENTTTDAGKKMKAVLKTAMEITSNGLDIVSSLSNAISSQQLSNLRRRLLRTEKPVAKLDGYDDEEPPERNLLQDELPILGHDYESNEIPPWITFGSRRLLDDTQASKIKAGVVVSSDDYDYDYENDGEEAPNSWWSGHRSLLQDELPILGHEYESNEIPSWITFGSRRLLDTQTSKIKPDVVVAKDGSGDCKTINQALLRVPKNTNKTFVLYIKEGIYNEYVQFNKSVARIFVYGDGPDKTRITGNKSFADGVTTYHTATVAVVGDNFMAKNIGFENSAGASKHQAVALRVSGDFAIFYNCSMDGYQDTLYTHTKRQFYRDCTISGTIDFVFGDAAAAFQNCTFLIRRPMENQQCIVTAQGRKQRRQPSAIVIQNSTITADPEFYPDRLLYKSYLGRPWKEYSRTIIMESFIDDFINPDGWLPWLGTFGLKTCWYGEYGNYGPGAKTTGRVKWNGIKKVSRKHALNYTPARFIRGDAWILPTGIPYSPYLTTKP